MALTVAKSPVTLIADEALEPYRLVYFSAAGLKVSLNTAGNTPDGVTLAGADADGDEVSVALMNHPGTVALEAAGSITANALVYAATSGKITSTANGDPVGRALDAASGNGSVIGVALRAANTASTGDIEDWFQLRDDFLYVNVDETGSEGMWDSTVENSSTWAANDEHGGVAKMTTGATDNNQHLLATHNEIFKIQASKDFIFRCRVKITEGNTDEGMAFIGFSDTVTADHLVDNTGAIRSSFDGFGIYKSAGDNLWRVVSSNAASQTAESTGVTATSGSWFKFKVVGIVGATNATLYFYYYDEDNDTDYTLVKTHTLAVSGLEEMHGFITNKTGGSQAEVLDVDYFELQAQR